jgi:hypothetical protein
MLDLVAAAPATHGPNTYMGVGVLAVLLLVIWLIRRA